MLKIAASTVNEILRLHEFNTSASEIAKLLNIKKMQVTAIIAHHAMKSLSPTVQSPLRVDEVSASDLERAESTIKDSTADEVATEPILDTEIQDSAESEGILIGTDSEYNDLMYWTPEDTQDVPNPHMMIMGESGSGKTYSVQCLTAELAQQDIPSIIFDYGQGFETQELDETYRSYTKPKEYLLGEDGIPLNPLRIFPADAHGPKSVATRLSDVFDAVYALGPIQRRVLIDAILLSFERAGISSENRNTWEKQPPSIETLQTVLEDLSGDKSYPNAKNAVGLAARLTTFFMLASFSKDETGWSWDRLLGDHDHRIHILQFRGLEGKTQRVLVEVLLWHLFFFLKSKGQSQLRMYCILDEAHHLSFRDGGPINTLLREGRKFGLGIMFASQQPEDFSEAAYANSASKLVFQTADPNLKVSKFLASKCKNYDSPNEIHETIAVLPKGEALFMTRNRGHKVKVMDIQRRATFWGAK